MSMSVTVSSSLLEDIFRLLEYLDILGNNDDLHFHKSGYSPRFERDSALVELKLKIKRLRLQIVETYLLNIEGITEAERRELIEWIAAGNGAYDNPCSLCDGSGRPMDFIKGCRTALEMATDQLSFFGVDPNAANGGGWDDDLPF